MKKRVVAPVKKRSSAHSEEKVITSVEVKKEPAMLPSGTKVGDWVRITYDKERTKKEFPQTKLSQFVFKPFLGKVMSLEGANAEIELVYSEGGSEKIPFDVDLGIDTKYHLCIFNAEPVDNPGSKPQVDPVKAKKEPEVGGETEPFDDEVVGYK